MLLAGLSLKSLTLIKWKDDNGQPKKFNLIQRVSSKWESFGFRLEIPDDVLVGLREQCLANSAKCWTKIMQYWLSGGSTNDYPATWEGLYVLLEDVDLAEVARETKQAVSAAKRQHML